jgi:AcrR family transcriptional regulator
MRRDDLIDQYVLTMELLWRSPGSDPSSPSPGPKPRLEVDDVVATAIAVADANLSAGVSMRAVAEQLGVTAMTIYGYVPGKEALVALMYDAIHAEMPDHRQRDADWRSRVRTWAEDLVELYVRHPWALGVSYARPVLGPHEQRVLESLVRVLRDTGLAPGLLRRVVGMLFHVVRGTAVTIAEGREAAEVSGVTEGEWWKRSSEALSRVVPDFSDQFPDTMWLLAESTEASVGTDDSGYVDHHARANLRVGLDVLLDGLQVAANSR